MGDEDEVEAQPGSTAAAPATASSSNATGSSTGGTWGHLRFNPPKNFDGKEQTFEEWSYKLRAYLALSNAKFKKNMVEYENYDEPVDFDILHQDEQVMATQLQNILISLCDGPAARIVHRSESDFDNGFEFWQLLFKRYAPLKRAKTTNRLTKIINWTFKEHDLETSFNECETEIYR